MTSGHRDIGTSGHRGIGTSERARYLLSAVGAALIAITPLGAQTPDFLTAQAADEPIVRGVPYSGESITTVKMKMFDGTNIERSVTARIFRDSLGRVRREQTVMGLEALDTKNDVRAIVLIIDPVANSIYSMVPGTNTAQRLVMSQMSHLAHRPEGEKPREETLGTRDIDGIMAIGYRMTTTIPAGQVGNDRPITITDERWEARDLKVLVESRHHDPRTGDVEYRLTKISRKEPPVDLFKVPAGYKIVDIPPKGSHGGQH